MQQPLQRPSFRGALLREPRCAIAHRGIHNHRREYGFPDAQLRIMACASGRLSPTEDASRNDGRFSMVATMIGFMESIV
jgi:hypothetical protein